MGFPIKKNPSVDGINGKFQKLREKCEFPVGVLVKKTSRVSTPNKWIYSTCGVQLLIKVQLCL